jgi:IS30 family transposase
MGGRYRQLTLEERHELFQLQEPGMPASVIATRLGRHRSTIDRELARNRRASGALNRAGISGGSNS